MTDNDQEPSRVWLITGCSSGFGRALAELALKRGHRVIATARRRESLSDLASHYPDRCRAIALDVTEGIQVIDAVVQTVKIFGRLDVLVNNAGYGVIGALEEMGEDQIERSFQTNFFGALALIREALPILRKQRRGHIVNISAAAAISNYAGFSVYGATKSALEAVSESLAAELKPLGIKVSIVQPGPFRTGFITRSLERGATQIADYASSSGKFLRYLEAIDGKQPGDPRKAAEAIVAVVETGTPPLRLVLGKYATEKVRKKLAATASELAVWECLGSATDFNSTHETS